MNVACDEARVIRERYFVVTAMSKGASHIGWRTVLLGAASEDEAIGKAMRTFMQDEPEANISQPGVIEITEELLLRWGFVRKESKYGYTEHEPE